MTTQRFEITPKNGAHMLLLGLNMAVQRGIDETLKTTLPQPIKKELLRRKVGILKRRIDLIDKVFSKKSNAERTTLKVGLAYQILWAEGFLPPLYKKPD